MKQNIMELKYLEIEKEEKFDLLYKDYIDIIEPFEKIFLKFKDLVRIDTIENYKKDIGLLIAHLSVSILKNLLINRIIFCFSI